MKVILFLVVLLQGDAEPHQNGVEQPGVKECYEQLGKLLSQPMPRNVRLFQAGCALVKDGEPA